MSSLILCDKLPSTSGNGFLSLLGQVMSHPCLCFPETEVAAGGLRKRKHIVVHRRAGNWGNKERSFDHRVAFAAIRLTLPAVPAAFGSSVSNARPIATDQTEPPSSRGSMAEWPSLLKRYAALSSQFFSQSCFTGSERSNISTGALRARIRTWNPSDC
jgi:hypothetical protein